MSSLIAHLAAGATVCACRPVSLRDAPPRRVLLPACMALAVLPDVDYLAWWLFHINAEPRLTHSLAFTLAAAALAWFACRRGVPQPRALFGLLLAAAATHPLLDFLVGVHPLPLAWPVSGQAVTSPVGVLPSAGRLDFGNPYLWRNLLIEAGVLGPVFALAVSWCRGAKAWPGGWPGLLATALAWVGFLAWAMSLPR